MLTVTRSFFVNVFLAARYGDRASFTACIKISEEIQNETSTIEPIFTAMTL